MSKSSNRKKNKGITQRKDGLYQGSYYDSDGKRKYLYDRNLRKLKQRIKETEEEVKKLNATMGISGYNINITFHDMYKEWYKLKDISNSIEKVTLCNYDLCYNAHIKNTSLDHTSIHKINRLMCENLIFASSNQKLTKIVLNNVFELCIKNDLIIKNPSKNIELSESKRKIEILTLKDQDVLLQNIHKEIYYNFVLLALHTGMRGSEICGLKIDDFDLNNGILRIDEQLVCEKDLSGKSIYRIKKLKTRSSYRAIPLDNYAKEAIKRQVDLRKRNIQYMKDHNIELDNEYKDILFITHLGKILYVNKINIFLRNTYNKIQNELSVSRLSTHMFRHTFATMCLDSEMHTRAIQTILGHRNDKITQLYAHVTQSHLMTSIEKLNNLYKKTS